MGLYSASRGVANELERPRSVVSTSTVDHFAFIRRSSSHRPTRVRLRPVVEFVVVLGTYASRRRTIRYEKATRIIARKTKMVASMPWNSQNRLAG